AADALAVLAGAPGVPTGNADPSKDTVPEDAPVDAPVDALPVANAVLANAVAENAPVDATGVPATSADPSSDAVPANDAVPETAPAGALPAAPEAGTGLTSTRVAVASGPSACCRSAAIAWRASRRSSGRVGTSWASRRMRSMRPARAAERARSAS